MARPSKLTDVQCDRIRMLRSEGISPPELAKRFKISESSLYKILNGSYVMGAAKHPLPPAVGVEENQGATPSLFHRMRASGAPELDREIASRVIKAVDSSRHGDPIDDVTLAAAELIVARAHYERASKLTR